MLVDTFSCVLTFMLVELYFSRVVVKYSIYKYRLPSIQPKGFLPLEIVTPFLLL